MSVYSSDLRVVWPREGWPPDVPALIRDLAGDGSRDRIVLRNGSGFTVQGATNEDPALRLGPFGALDEAIHAVIGDPR